MKEKNGLLHVFEEEINNIDNNTWSASLNASNCSTNSVIIKTIDTDADAIQHIIYKTYQ